MFSIYNRFLSVFEHYILQGVFISVVLLQKNSIKTGQTCQEQSNPNVYSVINGYILFYQSSNIYRFA